MYPPEMPPPEMTVGTAVVDPEVQALEQAVTPEEAPKMWETTKGKAIQVIVEQFEQAEQFVRWNNVMKWRKHLHYWNSVQYLAQSLVAHDWMTPDDILQQDPQADIDPEMYAKVINVYKANGEIIIGALASGTPTVKFFPKDADDPDDVTTSKAFSKIAELIQRHNKSRMLLMKALFIMFNQGMVACYNENKADYRFGSIEEQQFEDITVFDRQHYCPACGAELGADRWQPAEDVDPAIGGPSMPPQECPNCGTPIQPDFEDIQGTEQVPTGVIQKPKTREILEMYGPLNVKVPMWIKEQSQTPYLILETDESVFMMKEIYPEYADYIDDISYPDNWEREGRIPTHYRTDFPKGMCSVKRVWLRPWAYNYFKPDDEEAVELRKEYPDGLYAVIINNDKVFECVKDKLDDHWTLTENPLSEVIHAEPLGTPMVPLQDITNELANLTLETVEFGLTEVFADTSTLDFDAYPTQEARPGQISPAKAPPGQTLAAGFHEIKPAVMSREIELFAARVENMTQFVMGSYPSVYGGAQEGGGGTAKEYEMSKASALQRLGTTWVILQDWWATVIGKATKSFSQNMMEDEKFVQPRGGGFLNVWIRKIELNGEVGDIVPDVSEALPVSWSQKRDILLNLMMMKDERIGSILAHPENASLVAATIGLPELYIPGDDSRNKQLAEIQELIVTEPTQQLAMGPMGPMTKMLSSVPVQMESDEHEVEAEVCKAWLRSEVGQDAKRTNPGGYANVLAHLAEHQEAIQMMMPPPMEGEGGGEGEGEMGDVNENAG